MATTVKEVILFTALIQTSPQSFKEPRWGVTAGVSSADVMEPRSLTSSPKAVISS